MFYRYRSPHVFFLGERFFQKVYGRPLASTSPFTLFARWTEPQVFVLFGKRLEFGGNREVWKAFVCQYAPSRSCWPCGSQTLHARTQTSPPDGQCDGDVIDSEFALRRCVDLSSTERIFFFSFALFRKNVAIDLKCIENHGDKLHSKQRAASGAPSEIVKESMELLRERTLGAWRWIFKL